jgi:glycosyltransferase involved in cell wall biosynthesis
VGGFARALRTIVADPSLARSMGDHNRELVERRYAWDRVLDRFEGVYRAVVPLPIVVSERSVRVQSA